MQTSICICTWTLIVTLKASLNHLKLVTGIPVLSQFRMTEGPPAIVPLCIRLGDLAVGLVMLPGPIDSK